MISVCQFVASPSRVQLPRIAFGTWRLLAPEERGGEQTVEHRRGLRKLFTVEIVRNGGKGREAERRGTGPSVRRTRSGKLLYCICATTCATAPVS